MPGRSLSGFFQHVTRYFSPRKPAAGSMALAEALGTLAEDPDAQLSGNQAHALFAQVTGTGMAGNDFSAAEYRTLLKRVRKIYHLNGVGANLVDITVDFVVGEGLSLRALPSEGAEELSPQEQDFGQRLEGWWADERNSLEDEHDNLATLLWNEGQVLLLVRAINPLDGFVQLGHVANDHVERTINGPGGQPMVALVRAPGAADLQRIYLLNSSTPDDEFEFMAGPGQAASKRAPVLVRRQRLNRDGTFSTLEEPYDGIAFYLNEGRVYGAAGGKPMLGRNVDQLAIHDEITWAHAEWVKVISRFIIWAKITGAEADEIPDLLAAAGLAKPPEAGITVGTNEQWELKPISAQLRSQDISTLERTLRMIAAGSQGYPEAWTGSGEDVNRATLLGQNTVTFKRLRRRQKAFIRQLRMVVDFQIRQWKRHRVLPAEFEARYEVVRTSLDDKDRVGQFDALSKWATALTALLGQDAIPSGLGRKLTVQILREAGFEITEADLEEEEEGPSEALVELMAQLRARAQQQDTGQEPGEGGPDGQQEGGPVRAAGGAGGR